jgi:chromodomain-helicase-DNA-binding protein 4
MLNYPFAKKALTEYQRFSNRRKRTRKTEQKAYKELSSESETDNLSREEDDTDIHHSRSKRQRTLAILSSKISKIISPKKLRSTRSGRLRSLGNDYGEDESDLTPSESSGTRRSSRQRKRPSTLRYEYVNSTDEYSDSERGEQPSGRTSRSSAKSRPKRAIERFPTADDAADFAKRHQYWCMASSDFDTIEKSGEKKYVHCQGCSFMYHVECLGTQSHRKNRHNIIVVHETEEEKIYVLQCGRCKGLGKNGAVTMRCLVCAQVGDRAGDFAPPRKSSSDNPLEGWNDVSKLMFRCMTCSRACHFNHLPPPPRAPKPSQGSNEAQDSEEIQVDADPLEVYTTPYWRCNECRDFGGKKVDVILGWRPLLSPPQSDVSDFSREYLVKFEAESYARVVWVPATWLAGVAFMMKSNFDGKEYPAIVSSTDVVLDSWLRADIVFTVVYEDDIWRERKAFRSVQEEIEAISQVTSALCKWQKLTYEECMPPPQTPVFDVFALKMGLTWGPATWETPPKEDSPYWPDFKAAYEEHVRGNWIHYPNYRGKKIPYANPSKSEDVIQAEFGHRLEKKEQPEYIQGGKMFDYQLEGMK